MTIHASDPFATPDDARSPIRRLRGRLPAAVTLWTAYDRERRYVGLTVSSTVVVDGDPGKVLGVLDEESALWDAMAVGQPFAVMTLDRHDGQLADAFAGLMPAPGGSFAARSWQETRYGPVLSGVQTWAGCRLDMHHRIGWGLLVEATIEHVAFESTEPPEPLVRWRGRYTTG